MICERRDFLKIGLVGLAVILAMRMFLSFCLFATVNEFSLFDGDSCSRILNSWEWAKNPSLQPLAGDWLNLHFWTFGLGLKIYPDTVLVPIIINNVFSLGALIILFMLTVKLFPSNIAGGLLVSGIAAFNPFLIWLSFSGLPATIFYFLILVGIFCWVEYIKERKTSALIFAATAFLLSTGFRYEAWIFTFIFSCFVLREGWLYFREYRIFNWSLFLSGLLVWSFVLYWLIAQKIYCGNYFYFLLYQYEAVAGEGILGGLNVIEIIMRFFVNSASPFPRVVVFGSIFGVVLAGIQMFKSKKEVSDLIIFVSLQYIVLMGGYVFRVGGPWIAKSTAITFLLLLPFCGFVVFRAIPIRNRCVQIIIAFLLVIAFFWGNLVKDAYNPRYHLPIGGVERSDARQCGMLIRELYRSRDLKDKERVLLEQPLTGSSPNIWDGYFVRVVAPGKIIWDRGEKYRYKEGQPYLSTEDNPSKFDFPSNAINNFFEKGNIKIVIAVSAPVKAKLAEIRDEVLTIGKYSFYVRREEKSLEVNINKRSKELESEWYDKWWVSSVFQIRPFWIR